MGAALCAFRGLPLLLPSYSIMDKLRERWKVGGLRSLYPTCTLLMCNCGLTVFW
jgi:hypothetical protein